MKGRAGWAIGWLLLGAAPAAGGERAAAMPAATAIVAVEASVGPDAVTVAIRGNGGLSPGAVRRVEHFRPRLVLDFPGLAAETAAPTRVGIEPVDRVRVDRQSVGLTRVVLELSRSAPYRVEAGEPGAPTVRVVFPRPTAGSAARIDDPSGARPDPRRRVAVAARIDDPAGARPGPRARVAVAARIDAPAAARPGPRARVAVAARMDDPSGARPGSRRRVAVGAGGASAGTARLPGQPPAVGPTYAGDPVSMDFQNADLRAVLRVFAEISALNIVIDPSVRGEVNVALTEVPWDQAFDVILRANGLGYELDGNVVRIASIERLQEEAEARAVLARREAEAGELAVFTRTLSYARADDLVPLITGSSLSSRGEVFTDPRTNTLIVRDLEDRLPALDVLLDTLDRSEPQVEIEARVVRVGHDSARALGVQWGLADREVPGRGGTAAGASGSEVRTGPDGRLATGIDLGVGAPTSTLGVAVGPDGGPLDLDLTLSALESRGDLRIISSPRVTTQNNVQAEILQGDQIPYQTVANNTVTVEFKEAALTLRVTPQITAADTVIMQVEVENSFADFARALGNPPIPSIVTQRAATTVQVGDGETAVIGGIHENSRSEQSSRTPGLHRVPVLGWLFRSSARNESTDELMIFLTPRIVR